MINVYLHVCARSEFVADETLNCHPLDRQLATLGRVRRRSTMTRQTEIANLDRFTVPDENIACGQVAMNITTF